MRNSLIVGLILLLVAGCENGQLAFSDEARTEVRAKSLVTAEKRHALFVECMSLAANIKRDSDDDVSDIISDCANEAMYLANHYAQGN